MRHAVIMAGGFGTRLWPLSRRRHPKQLLRLFEGKSLLRRSYERLVGLLPPEQIYVITGKDYLSAMGAELPELPPENLLGEPCPRDTANAVGLAAHLLALRDPDGTMGVFTADQIITPVDVFQQTVAQGFQAAEQIEDALVTFGIRPTQPHTGYGYVHCGDELMPGVFHLLEFKEKPDLATAERYVADGGYFWNSGMFAWRLSTILGQMDKYQPGMSLALRQIAADFDDESRQNAVLERFSGLPRISIDYAILERADRLACVRMDCNWLDVGSWTSLAEVLAPDESGNTQAALNVLALDAAENIFVSETDHLIAAIGIKDLIVVHSEDVTLICRRQDAQRIKEMVEYARRETGDCHL